MKKKLESDVLDLETALEHANAANSEIQVRIGVEDSAGACCKTQNWILHTGKHDCNRIQRIRTTGLGVLFMNTVSFITESLKI